jgi:hypothetical protein
MNDETNNNNDMNDTNDTRTTNNARVAKNHFTIVDLCREHNINAKIARRRMRDAIKRNDERVVNARVRDNERDDSRVKHEFRDNAKNRASIMSIITND